MFYKDKERNLSKSKVYKWFGKHSKVENVHANIYKTFTKNMSIHFSFFSYQKMTSISQK
jgi:rubrerythrin